jgi:hypothetical protein
MAMGGNFYYQPTSGIHDPLFCKALAIEKDGVKAAIVGCDLESLHRPTVDAARKLISQKTGIRGENAMLSATHSHSGPEMTPMVLAGLPPEVAPLAKKYHEELPAKIAEAVRLAEADLQPAKVSAGLGHEDSISFNRRVLHKDGIVRMNWQKSPDFVRYMGPIDPAVTVFYFESPDAKPLATAVNFTLHNTIFGESQFSADYPGILAKRLAEVKGPDMMTLFTQGCSGNINQLDVQSTWKHSGPQESARVGTILSAEVLKTYKKLEPASDAPLRVLRAVVKAPVPEYSRAELAAAKKIIERSRQPGPGAPSFPEVVHANRVETVLETHGGKPLDLEVQVISLGDKLVWVGLPGEVFVELGLAIKLASPFPYTAVTELANGMHDYFPDRKAYDEGAYEPTTARCSAGCGELLVEAARKLLVEAYRGQPGALHPSPRGDGETKGWMVQ